ncbi:hypothetical protein D1AOALGA4SA_11071 [Olavius algarvensis Delta 1 endosymbiont]|nr:hypothetical protein D1AOALGA4SA_11071 [Olavius algarvensis Delta 1 endosymbiont]
MRFRVKIAQSRPSFGPLLKLTNYFVAENLGLWARSETIGCAVNPAASGSGMMEYWKIGMLGLVEWDLF